MKHVFCITQQYWIFKSTQIITYINIRHEHESDAKLCLHIAFCGPKIIM